MMMININNNTNNNNNYYYYYYYYNSSGSGRGRGRGSGSGSRLVVVVVVVVVVLDVVVVMLLLVETYPQIETDDNTSMSNLIHVVDEVTAGSVGAEAATVKRPTEFRLVARMSVDRPQLGDPVSELALVPVPARAARLLVRPTQLGLVSVACHTAAA